MAEYIDRMELYRAIENILPYSADNENRVSLLSLGSVLRTVLDAPTANVSPVVHAHWMFGDNNGHGLWMVCSNCGSMFTDSERSKDEMLKLFRGCPNCCARMDEEVSNEQR